MTNLNAKQNIAFVVFLVPSIVWCLWIDSALTNSALAFLLGAITCIAWYDTAAGLEE